MEGRRDDRLAGELSLRSELVDCQDCGDGFLGLAAWVGADVPAARPSQAPRRDKPGLKGSTQAR